MSEQRSGVTLARHPGVTGEPAFASGNLPPQLTSLLGRQAAVAELRSLVFGTRLLTLCGSGGAGKSRLAIALADSLREELADGVWWVDLSDTIDPGLVAQAIAGAVLPGSPAPDPAAAIARRFSGPALVVLDNCESVLDGCARLVIDLLGRAPTVRIVATSRRPLGIAGEQVWRVGGLHIESSAALDEGGQAAAVEDPTGGAVALFMQRAREADGAFDPDAPGVRDAVAAICRWLDGMPLAIELAAARVTVLGCGQIAERLRRDGALLGHASRSAPSRQRTLHATLDWSHQLLDADEQRLLRRLGAFHGSFSLLAAEAVCTGDGLAAEQIVDLLSRLIDQSLVQTVESVEEPRYRLLATVGQYALTKLNESDERDRVLQRHAAFYFRLGVEGGSELQGADQVLWLERLEREHDNLRGALKALFDEDPTRAAQLAVALWPFSYQRGYYSEARSWLERALTDDAIPPQDRIETLLRAGEVAFLQCDYPVAVDRLQQALALLGDDGEPRALATALRRLGSVAREQGRYDDARELHARSRTIWEQLGDAQAVAESDNYLGFVAWLSGDFADAEQRCAAALATFRVAGDLHNIAATLINFGAAATYRGELDVAAERLAEALALSRRLGFPEGIAWSLNELAVLARRRRRGTRQAELMLRDSLRVHQQLGDRWRITSVLEEIAHCALARRDGPLAVRLLACAASARERLGTPVPPAEAVDRDASIARLRRRLGTDAFADAWSLGRAAKLDDVIDDAVRALQPVGADDDRTAVPILTPRELAVLELLSQGHTNREIAATLYISPSTAGVHVSNILRKLRAKRRVDATAIAHQLGLLFTT